MGFFIYPLALSLINIFIEHCASNLNINPMITVNTITLNRQYCELVMHYRLTLFLRVN